MEEANGGTCTGKPTEIVQCKEKECPGKYLVSKIHRSFIFLVKVTVSNPVVKLIPFYLEDCVWNDWIIGNCSKICGGGTRTNTRTEKMAASHGGNSCTGPSTFEENCNIQECKGNQKLI